MFPTACSEITIATVTITYRAMSSASTGRPEARAVSRSRLTAMSWRRSRNVARTRTAPTVPTRITSASPSARICPNRNDVRSPV
jgi:hypothetical protein